MEKDPGHFQITNRTYPVLDGFRAIGILLVLAKHAFGNLVNLSFCWFGLEMLFTLSGFLITGILIETSGERGYLGKFYMRRVLRIFPPYFILIGLFYLEGWLFHVEGFEWYAAHGWYFVTYLQNWAFILDGIPSQPYLEHTWSLAVDEQIYLFWPFLLMLINRRSLSWMLALMLLLASIGTRVWWVSSEMWSMSSHPFPYFHGTFTRMDSFAIGSLLYCMFNQVKYLFNKHLLLTIIGTCGLIIIVTTLIDRTPDFIGERMRLYGFPVAGVASAAMIALVLSGWPKWICRLITSPVVTYTGKISYSLYVYHWVVIVALSPVFTSAFESFLPVRVAPFLSGVVSLALSFAIAALSYHWVEVPLVHLKRRFSYRIQ